MKSILLILINLLFLFPSISSAQTHERAIAILDLSVKNNESNNARLFSVEHMAKVTGIPFIITQDVEVAKNYAMILSSSLFASTTFSSDEKTVLIDYVQNGGVLVAPRIQDEDFYAVFGIDGYEGDNARFEVRWDSTLADASLKYINEPEERVISLGRNTYSSIYKTLGYSTTFANTLATYEDGSSAVIKNSYGNGAAVSVGFSWKEVILRNQINRDYEAQRITSNGFEPTSDVLFLFVRALFLEHLPHTVWKNTSPGRSISTLMITHDIDSATGMDTLEVFVDYEKNNGIEATYNITVRYFDDNLMSDFYTDRQSILDYIQAGGHNFGSHSVGHFFDFGDDDIFPIGTIGNTKDSYNPSNDGDITLGGTVYGELEVSKNVLEADIPNQTIRTFRAGHLAFHKYLVDILDELNYDYNSSFSANDVLTNFPYQNKMGRSFSGAISNVYEIPVTISDVFHSNPISIFNHFDKANTWLEVTRKNHANGAPTVLLIHPNRNYKLEGMSYYLDELPNDVNIMEFEKYGDFWRAREDFIFNSELNGNEMTITIPDSVDLTNDISFIVADGQSLSEISIVNELGVALNFSQEAWEGNDVIVYFGDFVNSTNFVKKEEQNLLKVFPNPVKKNLNIEFEVPEAGHFQIDLVDMNGKKVANLLNDSLPHGKHQLQKTFSVTEFSKGVYFVVMQNESGIIGRTKVVVM
ncbi:MAG: T9SS type A sorting domain-containing protein [Saprospiraceae bacterium]